MLKQTKMYHLVYKKHPLTKYLKNEKLILKALVICHNHVPDLSNYNYMRYLLLIVMILLLVIN